MIGQLRGTEQLEVTRRAKTFPINGTGKLITMFTETRQLSIRQQAQFTP
jgi:hypothetical protein